MWRNPLAAALLLVAITSQQQTLAKPNRHKHTISATVQAVLDAQRDAWNRGDVVGYMAGYDRSKNTVFVSGDTVTRGWQTVLDRYQKKYDSREKMGTLTFSELEITPIGNDAAIVLGRWHLQRANDEPHGRFTLILRRTKQGWKIVHDHTSSAS
ncbi:MAG TPA: nuclear transport factor 2 family protein [Pyrinomonadaceae bacterium]|jgi:ketosteroid isomerase-like protein